MAAATTVFRNFDLVYIILDYAFEHCTRCDLARLVRLTHAFASCGNQRLYRTLVLGRAMSPATATRALDAVARYERPARLVERLDVLYPTKSAKTLGDVLARALASAQRLHTLVLRDDLALPPGALDGVALPALRRLGMSLVVATGKPHRDAFLEAHLAQLTHLRLNSASAQSDVALSPQRTSYYSALSALGPGAGAELEYFQGSAWLAAHLLANTYEQPAQGKRLARGCTLFAEEDAGARGEGLKNGYAKSLLENLERLPAGAVRALVLDTRLAQRIAAVARGFFPAGFALPRITHVEVALKEPNHPFYLPMLTTAAESILPLLPSTRTLLLRARIAYDDGDIQSERAELAIAASTHIPRILRSAPSSLVAVRYSCSERWWDVGAKAWRPAFATKGAPDGANKGAPSGAPDGAIKGASNGAGKGASDVPSPFPPGAPVDPFAVPYGAMCGGERERERHAEYDTTYVEDALQALNASMRGR